ncbi:hypothetical protein MK280_11535 [Myxococcota bacterium]|nr:hypothetical protein [Myxococcota bacterium]
MPEQPPPLREVVAIPQKGRLEIQVDERRIVFKRSDQTSVLFEDHSIFRDAGSLIYAVAENGKSVLISRHAGDRLYFFDVDLLRFRTVPDFERLPKAESLAIHAVGEGYLVITENGLAMIDRAGEVSWRSTEVTNGWTFLFSRGDTLWLRDALGNVLGRDYLSGEEIGP